MSNPPTAPARAALRQCPLTCGLATRMTEGGWAKACEARRKLNEKFAETSTDIHVLFCRQCQGQIRPPQLEIINLEELSVGTKPSGEKEWVMPAELAEVLRPMSMVEANSATIKSLALFWRRPLIRSTHPSECPCCGGVHRLKNAGVCSGCNSDKVASNGLTGLALLDHLAKRAAGINQRFGKKKVKSTAPASEPPAVEVNGLGGTFIDFDEASIAIAANPEVMLADELSAVATALRAGDEKNIPLVAARRMSELAEVRATIREHLEMIALLEVGMSEAIADGMQKTMDAAVVGRWSCLSEPLGYEALSAVLQEAIDQAAFGKGLERHADGRPFHDQPIMRETLAVGLGFPAGQARKKILEAVRCCDEHPERAVTDLLGSINYIAALVIAIRTGMQEQAA